MLGSHRPDGTPDEVVGGPRTIETYRRLDALDRLGLIVLPLVGDGLQLTPAVSSDTALQLEEQRALPTGAVELVYTLR